MFGRFPANLSQHLLQTTHTGFARVPRNHQSQHFLRDHKLPLVQTMLFHLLGQQMVQRDLPLFLLGVGGQLDDFHTIQQRTRHGGQIVRCGQEQHIRQVERQLDIMIAERNILLGVQHLQHRRRRVAPKIVAHFVNLVEQKQRIGCARAAQCIHDASRHRADIRLAMTTDIRFISHAA